ncbi:ribulose-bisphosphate carboxylase large subunit family protein [Pseudomonas lalucatii]|uniref:Ribulose-bisphosphate carboxylase large subunit family protein n=1 Tax=Pseudomonas lalucatii TaxID=1424203 RepID=A0ABS5Q7W2_9PSED|nr:ribulose-bisphosphate carboxylase large subunit family protein [Pseudomonas lalucatii]MBS7664447.1 ribulose-bisphosphate carboxylase large subunit family protein [Pseudomonas lalucatii]MBS7725629.1 ribulose-bisphosphate carboxylase large subunit family protein [Pseudomonas lalucatii]NQD91538.1 ribulose 1,5-bisphosphate carboxylase [Pseudomonas sp. CrR25]QVM88752.1 ribulose-bisphosphate carboxylase large subunit family protein [Pseudomonas lalucatii]
MAERIRATYWIETPYPIQVAAEVMAGEQSSGTFTRLAAETDELRLAHCARVESIVELDSTLEPSLPMRPLPASFGSKPVYRRARVELSWPIANMGPSLPNLLATVAGNLFELKEFSGLKLLDIQLTSEFAQAYRGPAFGIGGTRVLAGVNQGPLIGTIIKPSVGLSPAATAAMVKDLVAGGIDFIKDDELQANGPHNPLTARVDAVMQVINEHAERTGKKVMYAFNITDEIDEMQRHHDYVVSAGGTCVMATLNSVGLPGLAKLRQYSAVPIHGHRAGWGLYSRSPFIGFSYVAYQKLWRLAGVDHLHVNGLRNKFSEADDSVIVSAKTCQTPMFDAPHNGCTIMPVFSSAQSAEQVADTYAALGNTDLIYCCGGGIMAHPGGIQGGVSSLRQAWDATVQGIALETYAKEHPALADAIKAFRS